MTNPEYPPTVAPGARIDHPGDQAPAADDRQIGVGRVGYQQSVDQGVTGTDRQRPIQCDAGPGEVEVGHGAADVRPAVDGDTAGIGKRPDRQRDIGAEPALQARRHIHGPGGQADRERRTLVVRTRVRELGQGMGVIIPQAREGSSYLAPGSHATMLRRQAVARPWLARGTGPSGLVIAPSPVSGYGPIRRPSATAISSAVVRPAVGAS